MPPDSYTIFATLCEGLHTPPLPLADCPDYFRGASIDVVFRNVFPAPVLPSSSDDAGHGPAKLLFNFIYTLTLLFYERVLLRLHEHSAIN